jgi:hypothetical protein
MQVYNRVVNEIRRRILKGERYIDLAINHNDTDTTIRRMWTWHGSQYLKQEPHYEKMR